ncbi:tetratricopeptide repeat protein [bacterium]|nr:tetratricopeptide repeat protein [bacterium]
MDRLKQLEEMMAREPDDAFTRYALALELRKLGRINESLDQFEQVIGQHPDYVPAYFMIGQLLADEGRTEDAKQRLREGVAMAQRAGDAHAQGEMQEYLDDLD